MQPAAWTAIGVLAATVAIFGTALFATLHALDARIDALSERIDAHIRWHAG